MRVPWRDGDVLDGGPKGTMLQRISTLSIHDACVKRSFWVAYQKELEKIRARLGGYLKHDPQTTIK
jgi:hypothetical protein